MKLASRTRSTPGFSRRLEPAALGYGNRHYLTFGVLVLAYPGALWHRGFSFSMSAPSGNRSDVKVDQRGRIRVETRL
jgi:hypothetical protein